jgi:hypothetical protein
MKKLRAVARYPGMFFLPNSTPAGLDVHQRCISLLEEARPVM